MVSQVPPLFPSSRQILSNSTNVDISANYGKGDGNMATAAESGQLSAEEYAEAALERLFSSPLFSSPVTYLCQISQLKNSKMVFLHDVIEWLPHFLFHCTFMCLDIGLNAFFYL